MNKRFISLSLCVVFAVTSATPAFADTDTEKSIVSLVTGKDTISSAMLNELEDDIAIIKEKCNISAELTNIDVSDDVAVYEYTYKDDGTVSLITVNEMANGAIQIDIKEGTLHNTLLYNSNGSVQMNGNEVAITTQNVQTTNSEIQPLSYYEFISTSSPPYGSASDYTYKAGKNSLTQVKLGVTWQEATRAGTEAIITGAVIGLANLPLGVAIFGGGIATFASMMLSNGKATAPTSQYASFSVDQYYHKTSKAFRANASYSVRKNSGYGYVEKNFEGKKTNILFYDCVDHT